jgi:hypothetical protein
LKSTFNYRITEDDWLLGLELELFSVSQEKK